MNLSNREWGQIAFKFAMGLATGVFASYYIYDTPWTWVPPAMVLAWVGFGVQGIRTDRKRAAAGPSPDGGQPPKH